MHGPSRGRLAVVLTVAALVGVLGAASLVWRSTSAAFTATGANEANTWTAGHVMITNETTSLLFNVAGLKPGDTGERCIVVTYNGDLAASVKLYASASSGTLGQYIDFTIDMGSGGNYANCGAFSAESTAYPTDSNVTLQYFGTNRTSFATGVGSWTPAGAGQTKVYRFSYVVNPAMPDGAASTTAGVTFTWEARNS